MRLKLAATAGAALLALTACGGGSSGNEGDNGAGNGSAGIPTADPATTNGAIPDEMEGNTNAEQKNLKTGEPGNVGAGGDTGGGGTGGNGT